MNAKPSKPTTIDEYIEAHPPEVQAVLKKIRQTIRKAAPAAEERISYQMPAFFLHGALAYFGGFQKHIGLYPPVKDKELQREAAPYAGEKGNLKFPLDKPIPYALIRRIVKGRVVENLSKQATKRRKSR